MKRKPSKLKRKPDLVPGLKAALKIVVKMGPPWDAWRDNVVVEIKDRIAREKARRR